MNACVFFLARAKYAFDYTASTDARTAGFAVFGMAQACLEAQRKDRPAQGVSPGFSEK